LQPLQELSGKKAAVIEEQAKIVPVVSRNIANIVAKKSHATKEGQVRVREPKARVHIREGRAAEAIAARDQQLLEPPPFWDDKRVHGEDLINNTITKGISGAAASDPDGLVRGMLGDLDGGGDAGPDSAGTGGNPVGVSFDARRRYLQVAAKQIRDSEQQKCIGQDKQSMARQTSLLGAAGATVANVGVNFRGLHGHLGFSHHHLTNSVEPSRLEVGGAKLNQKELGHSWDGSHIDHAREQPQKYDVKFSKLNREEREGQFGTYFTKLNNQVAKVDALDGVKDILDPFKPWSNHEYRSDQPHRHGKYGRRVFDPQVRETQINHTISGIVSKPMEEFHRQTDLVNEFLDRSLPANQSKHFEQYLPTAEFPYRKEVDMIGRHMTGAGNAV